MMSAIAPYGPECIPGCRWLLLDCSQPLPCCWQATLPRWKFSLEFEEKGESVSIHRRGFGAVLPKASLLT